MAVNWTRRVFRSTSFNPSADSSSRTCTVSAGCERCSSTAARVKLRVRREWRRRASCRRVKFITPDYDCHRNYSIP
jgi:hypothetical protein